MTSLPDINRDLVKLYEENLRLLHSKSTAKRRMSSLRKFFSWAEHRGHIEENPFRQKNLESRIENLGQKISNAPKIPDSSLPKPGAGGRARFHQIPWFKAIFVGLGAVSAVTLATLLALSNPDFRSPFIALKGFAQGIIEQSNSQGINNNQNIPTAQMPISNHPTTTQDQTSIQKSPSLVAGSNDTIVGKIFSLVGASPVIEALEGTLGIKSQGITLQTTPTSDGNITLSPDGNGQVKILSSTTNNPSLSLTNANLTTGSLIYGYVGNNGSNYKLIELKAGSTPQTQFSVDAQGNTFIRGKLTADSLQLKAPLNLESDLKINGVTRFNSLGRLASITGYYQDSGLFEIDQGSPDFARITKTPTKDQGAASADVLTLTLDESNVTTGSAYDTLVLSRKNAASGGYALYVSNGDTLLAGNLTINGNTTFGSSTSSNISFTGRFASSLIPASDNLYDLGENSTPLRWRTGYFGTSVKVGSTGTLTTNSLTFSSTATLDSASTLSINTTNNQAITTGTGTVTLGGAATLSSTLGVTGNTTLTGDLAVNGGNITTTSATFNLANAATTLNLGSTAVTRTINIGTGTAADTINIGTGGTTADTINIGTGATANSITIGTTTASTSLALNDDNWNISGAGAANFVSVGAGTAGSGAFTTLSASGTISANGGTIGTSATTFNLVNTTATTVNFAGAATTISLGATTGTTTINNALTATGTLTASGNTTLGTTSANTVAFNAVVASNIVADANTRNLGSSSTHWANAWIDTVNASNLSGTVTGGSTSSSSWTINSANSTNDAQISTLAFERGTPVINAVEQWNASGDTTNKVAGFDNYFLFNFPIGIYAQVSGANTSFTGGSIFKYSQPSTNAITQASAFIGAQLDLSSNITVPNTSSGNQTGVQVTLADGGASATAIGFQTAGTMDIGLDIGGTIGTAEIRLSNSETIDNKTDNTVNLGFGATGGILKLTNGSTLSTDQTTFNLINTTSTTLNIGGAATTVSLGASSGTTTVNNALTVTGNFSQSGSSTFGTGTGAISLNGDVTIAAGKGLTFTSGTGLLTQNYSNTTGTAQTTNLTGAATTTIGHTVDQTATYTATTTNSGNLLKLNRALTINAAATTLTVSGAVLSVSDNCTQTTGTCTNTANVLSLTQSYSSSSGNVLSISNAGTGNAIEIAGAGTRTINSTSGNLTIQTTTSGTLALDAAGTLTVGTTNQTGLTLGRSGAATTINGSSLTVGPTSWTATPTISGLITASAGITIAANQNLTLNSGTGTITQNYSNTTGTAATFNVTDSASSGTTTVKGQSIAITGTANALGSNTITGIDFANVAAATNNTYYGINFGTGLTDILRYNGSQLISGSGVLQSAGLSGTYSNALTLSSASNSITVGTLTTTGGTINGTSVGATTASTGAFTTLSSTIGTTLASSSGNTAIGNATGTLALTSTGLNVTTAGAVSGVTTLGLSGAITGATSTNTINNVIINAGAVSGVTTLSTSGNVTVGSNMNATYPSVDTGLVMGTNFSAGQKEIDFFNTASAPGSRGFRFYQQTGASSSTQVLEITGAGAATFAGAVSGVTTLGLSGAITGATATNTINNVIINAGAVSGVTTLDTSSTIHSTSGIYFGTSSATTTMGISNNFGGNDYLTLAEGSSGLRVVNSGNSAEHFKIASTGAVTFAGAVSGVTTLNTTGVVDTTTYYKLTNGVTDVGTITTGSNLNIGLARNAYNDGTNWQRINTSNYVSLVQAGATSTSSSVSIYTAAPATNPISNWVNQFIVDSNGAATFAGPVSGVTTGTAQIWGASSRIYVGSDNSNTLTNIQGSAAGDSANRNFVGLVPTYDNPASSVANGLSYFPTVNLTGTIADLRHVWIRAGNYTAGTVTNNYGLYVENPSTGSNVWAIYATGMVETTGQFKSTSTSAHTLGPVTLTNGAVAGVTTLGLSGAITGATATNTINGMIINSGAVSGVTTLGTTGKATINTATNGIPLEMDGNATSAQTYMVRIQNGGSAGSIGTTGFEIRQALVGGDTVWGLSRVYAQRAGNGTADLVLAPSTASDTPTDSLWVRTNGDIHGLAGSTGMTAGFIYIPAAAGAPTGTPTSRTGLDPIYYDNTNNKLCSYNAAWKCLGGFADVAEWMPAAGAEIGDIVATTQEPNTVNDPTAPFMLGKSQKAYEEKIIGIVSQYAEDANMALGYKKSPDYHAVAVAGRVPLKVSTINGAIQKGDPLTSSPIPGVAMKATSAGQIVGKALENFDGENGQACEYQKTASEEAVYGGSTLVRGSDPSNQDTLTQDNNFVKSPLGSGGAGSRTPGTQFDGPDPHQATPTPNVLCSKIIAFINVSWYDPDVYLTDTGDLRLVGNSQFSISNFQSNSNEQNSKFNIQDSAGKAIQRVGAFSDAMIANLKAGLIQTQELVAQKIEADNIIAKEKFISPIVETDTLAVNTIKPNNPQGNISIDLSKSATESGTLAVHGNVNIEKDATVSGTLYADRIKARQIEGLQGTFEEIAASTSAVQQLAFEKATASNQDIINQIKTRIDNLSQDIQSFSQKQSEYESIQKMLSDSATPSATLAFQAQTWTSEPASSSAVTAAWLAVAANVPSSPDINLTGNLNTLGNLNIYGTTTLADTYIKGKVIVISDSNYSLSLSDNTISVAGTSLSLIGSSGVNIMNNALVVDSTGNTKINGNLFVNGTVRASGFAPAGGDLTLNLKKDEGGQSGFGSLLVKGVGDQTVASIDASGSATLRKLVIAADNSATSSAQIQQGEIQTNATAGSATLPAGLTELRIKSNQVTDQTLVYVTPTSSTENRVLYVKNKVAGDSFTVAIDQAADHDISFNWWIIDLKK